MSSVLVLAVAGVAAAQRQGITQLDFGPGSEHEEYLRVLQIAGIAPLYPWSIRGFAPRELDRLIAADTTGPWRLGETWSPRSFAPGPLSSGLIFNSAFPYGSNDGPVWAGRGLTVAVSGGIALRAGPVSATVAPTAFYAMNQAFRLMDNGESGHLAFADGNIPDLVDRPQRFGDAAYRRIDPGTTTLRFDLPGITFGASSANEWIGPATEYPFILGSNAPGILRVFLGTGEPLPIGIGRLHARFNWGRLDQSAFSPVQGSDRFVSTSEPGRTRLASSSTIVFLPRGARGLELGVSRFVHLPYPAAGIPRSFWSEPFNLRSGRRELERGEADDNQLVAVFFRWAFPQAGFEVYGERGYEDWFYDLRELLQQSDYHRSYSLGVQKLVGPLGRSEKLDVLRAELINYQRAASSRHRPNEWTIYAHSTFRQGHTNRGQVLGTDAGVGVGAASIVSWTRYTAEGRLTIGWRRTIRAQEGMFYLTGVRDDNATDVIHSLGIERMRLGRTVDVTLGLDAMANLNRDFRADVFNLNARLGLRWRPQARQPLSLAQ